MNAAVAALLDQPALLLLLLLPALYWWTARERAELRRERAERLRERRELLMRLVSAEGLLQSRFRRIMSREGVVRAEQCAFALSWEAGGGGHGVGVLCGAPGAAVTAARYLKDRPHAAHVFGAVYPGSSGGKGGAPTLLELEVLHIDWELDVATLRLLTPRGYPHFLECYTGPPSDVAGASLALCMFQLSESELPGFGCGIGVLPADGVRLSADARHLLYACPAYAGDSGAAFLMADEQLVGVHHAFVNQLREQFERKHSVDEPLTGVEVSLEALVAGAGRGTCVALLASQLPPGGSRRG